MMRELGWRWFAWCFWAVIMVVGATVGVDAWVRAVCAGTLAVMFLAADFCARAFCRLAVEQRRYIGVLEELMDDDDWGPR
jgi:hypothetical protein